YLVASAAFLGVAGTLALERLGRVGAPLLAAVLTVQLLGSAGFMRTFDSRLHPEVRAELVERLLMDDSARRAEGTVCVVSRLAPRIDLYLPEVHEQALLRPLLEGWRDGLACTDLLEQLAPMVELELHRHPVLIDLTDPGEQWDHADPDLARYVQAFIEATLERFPHQRHEQGGWTLAALEPLDY
ncbi:MAG: hypothetical protein AAFZ65_05865, partial [Planctomycetota bacterium]